MSDLLRSRGKPIYGTDITQPLPELIEGLRSQLVRVRGQISDIQHHIGFRETLEPVVGLLTCGIVNLFCVKEEIEKALRNIEGKR